MRINRLWVKESGGKRLRRHSAGFTWTPEMDEDGNVTNLDQLQAYMDELDMSPQARADMVEAMRKFADSGGTQTVSSSRRRFRFSWRSKS